MWQPEPPTTDLSVAHARDSRPHAVIIGTGIGGLAAGIRLGARGYRVTLVDALPEPGGRAAPWRQDGFIFDAGPTIITAPFLLDELWALCGRKMADDITLKPLDPFSRLDFADGSTLECNGDMADMTARIRAMSPGDEAGYRRFMAESEAIFRVGFEQLSTVPFSKITDMLKVLPDMVRMRADRSLYKLAARHVKDERLRTALSFHPLFIGGNPFDVTSVYGLILHLEKTYGVHYVMGGTAALVQGLVNLLHRQGATFRMNSPVRTIEVDAGRASGVRLSGGDRIEADIVVSNACIGHTYNTLLAGLPRKRWTAAKLRRTRFSMGVFVWYFGTNRRYEAVPHHTIQLGPRYRGLLDDIFHKKVVADDFSLYLHRPSATDPSVAPPGHDAFYALVPVPNLQGGQDWASLAEPFRLRIVAHLERTLLPGLSEAVVSSHVTTPLDFETRLLSTQGAAFGPEPILFQSAYFRPHNVSEEVPNLYLVGAGTHPGAGVPGVLCSARILDEVVPHAAHA